MTTLKSYDLNGKKLSFANWISNLSPQETPFTSMTGKESINQTMFQWQTDSLAKAGKNAAIEGDEASDGALRTTSLKSNITQILRKVVKVSDTANALANYGRGRELQYQMEKAGKEIKRDLEFAFLNNEAALQETTTTGRETAGFIGLVAPFKTPCPETGAIVHTETAANDTLSEADIFNMTYQLYLSGSKANVIMFHPKFASVFSSLQEKANVRERIFENTPKFSVYVSTMVDPLGQEFKLIPNRWMPKGAVYFFNASDWTQMVLRAPQRTKLAKDGSYEKWMIEMEVGLRHRHPYASGVLDIKVAAANDPHNTGNTNALDSTNKTPKLVVDNAEKDLSSSPQSASADVGKPLKLKGIKSAAGTAGTKNYISVMKDGVEVWVKSSTGGTAADANDETTIIAKLGVADSGMYTVHVTTATGSYTSYGLQLDVTPAKAV